MAFLNFPPIKCETPQHVFATWAIMGRTDSIRFKIFFGWFLEVVMGKSLPFVLLFSTAFAWETGCKPQEDRLKDEQAAAAAQVEPVAPQMPDQVAKVGVGVKGDSLDSISENDPRLLIAGPAKTYFNVKERVVFDIKLPHASQLYNAMNSRNPKTHEEYMREIVEANKIELPKLREGMVYRYHPDTNELWVESDKSKP